MAIDLANGSLAWEKPRLSLTSYGTPSCGTRRPASKSSPPGTAR